MVLTRFVQFSRRGAMIASTRIAGETLPAGKQWLYFCSAADCHPEALTLGLPLESPRSNAECGEVGGDGGPPGLGYCTSAEADLWRTDSSCV